MLKLLLIFIHSSENHLFTLTFIQLIFKSSNNPLHFFKGLTMPLILFLTCTYVWSKVIIPSNFAIIWKEKIWKNIKKGEEINLDERKIRRKIKALILVQNVAEMHKMP